MLAGIERFLVEYSEVEGNKIEFDGVRSRKKTLGMIDDDRKRFEKRKR
jgi:hypothetical protein